nr:type II toxin-antitoxin system RelE/ParE family toxin [Bacteroidota bacterium]
MNVFWTPTARLTYLEILEYLERDWTFNEIKNFILEVDDVIEKISRNPYMFPPSRKEKSIRKGFVTSHNSLYYRINEDTKDIELLTFWDNRQDPKKLIH